MYTGKRRKKQEVGRSNETQTEEAEDSSSTPGVDRETRIEEIGEVSADPQGPRPAIMVEVRVDERAKIKRVLKAEVIQTDKPKRLEHASDIDIKAHATEKHNILPNLPSESMSSGSVKLWEAVSVDGG
jgi:hypothetical protein